MAILTPYGSGFNVYGVSGVLADYWVRKQQAKIAAGTFPGPAGLLLPMLRGKTPSGAFVLLDEEGYYLQLVARRGLYAMYLVAQQLVMTYAADSYLAVPPDPNGCGYIGNQLSVDLTTYGTSGFYQPPPWPGYAIIQPPVSVTIQSTDPLCPNLLTADIGLITLLTVKLPYQKADSRENPAEYAVDWWEQPNGSATLDDAGAWVAFDSDGPMEGWAAHYSQPSNSGVSTPERYPQ